MDYQTRPTSRKMLRSLAKVFRELFNVPQSGSFPVMETLDKISDIFPGCYYTVVEDRELPSKTMAQCRPNDEGGFTIYIRESVYNGAARGIGAYLGFICHELCHIFLFQIGFTPIFNRSFDNNSLPAYCSVEWQAKALCGEVMIPYAESIGLNQCQLIERYHVSNAFARYRCRQLKEGPAYECNIKDA